MFVTVVFFFINLCLNKGGTFEKTKAIYFLDFVPFTLPQKITKNCLDFVFEINGKNYEKLRLSVNFIVFLNC